jgi:predicted molibdopterin-dependent oxidoreductase YjgC
MKEDLTHLLICWKNDERRLGIRKVKIRNSTIMDGEFLILVSESLKVVVKNRTKDIEIEKVFQTFNQSGSIEIANGDLYRAEQITNNVSLDFFKLYSDTIQELFLDVDDEFIEIE